MDAGVPQTTGTPPLLSHCSPQKGALPQPPSPPQAPAARTCGPWKPTQGMDALQVVVGVAVPYPPCPLHDLHACSLCLSHSCCMGRHCPTPPSTPVGVREEGVVVVVVGLQDLHLHWYRLELGSDPPTPLLTTILLWGV